MKLFKGKESNVPNDLYWCPMCGFEDSVARATCGSCNCALKHAPGLFLNHKAGNEETSYELDIATDQRSAVVGALVADGIAHRWNSDKELVVATANEDAVDSLLDDVFADDVNITLEETDVRDDVAVVRTGASDAGADVDELGGVRDYDEDEAAALFAHSDDNSDYELMSATFRSADRLLKKWTPDDVGTFIGDATAVSLMSPPLGIDEMDWAEIASLARNCAMQLQEDDQADVEGEVKDLRNRLHALI